MGAGRNRLFILPLSRFKVLSSLGNATAQLVGARRVNLVEL